MYDIKNIHFTKAEQKVLKLLDLSFQQTKTQQVFSLQWYNNRTEENIYSCDINYYYIHMFISVWCSKWLRLQVTTWFIFYDIYNIII